MGVAPRKRERRLEVFEDAYTMWTERRLTRERAAEMLGVCDRAFRRWVAGVAWDLIVTMDDATNEHYSMFFREEEGLEQFPGHARGDRGEKGLCCSLYTDRASHYRVTPEAFVALCYVPCMDPKFFQSRRTRVLVIALAAIFALALVLLRQKPRSEITETVSEDGQGEEPVFVTAVDLLPAEGLGLPGTAANGAVGLRAPAFADFAPTNEKTTAEPPL